VKSSLGVSVHCRRLFVFHDGGPWNFVDIGDIGRAELDSRVPVAPHGALQTDRASNSLVVMKQSDLQTFDVQVLGAQSAVRLPCARDAILRSGREQLGRA
jgi:hypothetical protein